MRGFDLTFDTRDLKRFEKALDRAGKIPQRVVNKAALEGAAIVGAAVKAAAPVGKTGRLSRGFKREAEKSRYKGKKVYHYGMSDKKNRFFQKPIPAPKTKNPGKRRTSWPYAYYPASVEYGFLTRSQGGGLNYVPGQHFVRKAAEQVQPEVERVMIKTMADELEKEWMKKHAT